MAECRICFEEEEEEENKLMHPCPCKGTQKWIHEVCLKKWYFMNDQNKACSVCNYRFKVRRGSEYYQVPPNIGIFMENLRMHGILGAFQNLYVAASIFVFLFDPRILFADIYVAHGIYQVAHSAIYGFIFYRKNIHQVKNKSLYWSFIDSDTRQIIYLYIIGHVLLFYLKNPIYHLGCVFFTQYVYNPLHYYHYVALKELNQLAPVQFINFSD
jgi:hypothetical protein